MEKTQTQSQPKIDLKTTTPYTDSEGNHLVLQEAIVLRKVSKFLIGAQTDGIIPVPVMVDMKSGKIILDMIPEPIRKEYENIGI